MEKDKQWLAECRTKIEIALGWGHSDHWGNEDFELLSEKLWGKTKIRLSVSTLKRIWGRVRYENFPSSVTLNALASFLGYDHWRDFCLKNPVDDETQITRPKPANVITDIIIPDRKIRILRILVTAVIILTGLFAWLVYHYTASKKAIKSEDFKFTSRKVSDDLPNSVVFNYDASAAKTETVMIQQSWDSTRREIVEAMGKQHTSIYYYPGYFKAKLLVGERVMKENQVFIQTKGWKGIIGKLPSPLYLRDQDIRQGKSIGISDTLLKKKFNSSEFSGLWTEFVIVHEFPSIDAQNFTLQATFSNTSTLEESLCRRVKIEILGIDNAIIIPFSAIGCIAELNLFTGDRQIKGKDHDLSAFGCDYSHFQKLRCTVHDHQLKIFLNNQLIMNSPQQKSLGRIVGIRAIFEGAGSLKQATLETPNKMAYDLLN